MFSVANFASEQSSFIHFLFAHHVNLLLCKTVNSIAQCKKKKNLGQFTSDVVMFTIAAKRKKTNPKESAEEDSPALLRHSDTH